MPVRVRVQNFQSIKDAEVIIDGLTVITGTNNSGKSAFMRAVSGVFTNAPSGPLVRRGETHLTVDIEFADGRTVCWEKGPKINQYTVDGKKLAGVGRGVPPEVAELGVQEIKGGSDKLWPQVARQFDGSLFLVNRSGSVVAEALSDIKRVGRLTEALRLSEKDSRSVSAELKVRRKDLESFTEEAESFEGLAGVETLATEVDALIRGVKANGDEVQAIKVLRDRHAASSLTAQGLKGFDPSCLPSTETVESIRDGQRNLRECTALSKRHATAASEMKVLKGFDPSCVPSVTPTLQGHTASLKEALRLQSEWTLRREEARKWKVEVPPLPDSARAEKLEKAIEVFSSLQSRKTTITDSISQIEKDRVDIADQHKTAQEEVTVLLGSVGECPTCGTTHTTRDKE